MTARRAPARTSRPAPTRALTASPGRRTTGPATRMSRRSASQSPRLRRTRSCRPARSPRSRSRMISTVRSTTRVIPTVSSSATPLVARWSRSAVLCMAQLASPLVGRPRHAPRSRRSVSRQCWELARVVIHSGSSPSLTSARLDCGSPRPIVTSSARRHTAPTSRSQIVAEALRLPSCTEPATASCRTPIRGLALQIQRAAP